MHPDPLFLSRLQWAWVIAWHILGPFAGAMGLFLMSYIGIAISLYPMLVRPHYTLWDTASTPQYAGLPADRHAVPAADNLHVFGMVVLGVPRKGQG